MREPITSCLRVHPDNPRVFTDDTGRGIYLTGSHTWAVIQDIGIPDADPFPWDDWGRLMSEWNHNFLRMWMFEQPEGACWTNTRMLFSPVPWKRTGPGLAADGLPKFDLTQWDEEYFSRLHTRIEDCRQRGIYCSVMLFEGWSLNKTRNDHPGADPWHFHPFTGENNINGVDCPHSFEDSEETVTIHSMNNASGLPFQELYLAKVVEDLNRFDNLMWEISNEGGTTAWQYYMIRKIKEIEAGLPKQHLVGMTHAITPKMFNRELFESPADWISPAREPQDWMYPGSVLMQDYMANPPAATGEKIILNDTDHIWGHGGNWKWVWKCFTRGQHPLFMDPWWPLYVDATPDRTPWTFVGGVSKDQPDYPDWEPVRRAMGDTLALADTLDMARMIPRNELCTTGYCLADPGSAYVAYAPEGGKLTLDLGAAPGIQFTGEWIFPITSRHFPLSFPIPGGDYWSTEVPFTGDGVLVLKKSGG